MSGTEVGSGGRVERFIILCMGGIMGGIGLVALWLSYSWATTPIAFDYRWAYIAGSGALGFLMMRGAWYALKREKKETVIHLASGGRIRRGY